MQVPFVDLKAQYKTIKNEVDEAIQKVIDNTAFVLGEAVTNFEKNFAQYIGTKHCIAASTGTEALHLIMLAKGIKQGDEVITVPNTFIATAAAVSITGAKPVFVDIDRKTYNIDPEKIEKAITPKTKAIMPVHLYGQTADMDTIKEIAEKHNLILIEDACQAHGAEYKGKKAGSLGSVAAFSFYPAKNLGAYGEGGAITTNNDEEVEKIRMLRDQGQEKKYYHKYIGYNYRMEGIQGAVLGIKLKYLDRWVEARRKNAKLYNKLLAGVVETPYEAPNCKHAYHLYIIQTEERDKLQEFLKQKEISTGLHYPVPIHLQEAYSFMGLKEGSYPATEGYVKRILSLPMYAELTEEQINYVADAIKEFNGCESLTADSQAQSPSP